MNTFRIFRLARRAATDMFGENVRDWHIQNMFNFMELYVQCLSQESFTPQEEDFLVKFARFYMSIEGYENRYGFSRRDTLESSFGFSDLPQHLRLDPQSLGFEVA